MNMFILNAMSNSYDTLSLCKWRPVITPFTETPFQTVACTTYVWYSYLCKVCPRPVMPWHIAMLYFSVLWMLVWPLGASQKRFFFASLWDSVHFWNLQEPQCQLYPSSMAPQNIRSDYNRQTDQRIHWGGWRSSDQRNTISEIVRIDFLKCSYSEF